MYSKISGESQNVTLNSHLEFCDGNYFRHANFDCTAVLVKKEYVSTCALKGHQK